MSLPGYLYHYYEASIGPFVSLSDLPAGQAEAVLGRLHQREDFFAAKRSPDYLAIRHDLESTVRAAFIAKGGRPQRQRPHYMTLGACPWLLEWYPDGRVLRLSLAAFDPDTISFTYSDTFPAMRYFDDNPYRGQVYCVDELAGLVQQFGLPQEWNPDGKNGPDRYIEAQIWQELPPLELLDKRQRR